MSTDEPDSNNPRGDLQKPHRPRLRHPRDHGEQLEEDREHGRGCHYDKIALAASA